MGILILSVVTISIVGIVIVLSTILSQLIRIKRSESVRKAARKKGEFLYSKEFDMTVSDDIESNASSDDSAENKGKKVKKDSRLRILLFGKRKYLVSENGNEIVEVEPSPYWNNIEEAITFRKEVIYYKKKEIVIWTSENQEAEKLVKIS